MNRPYYGRVQVCYMCENRHIGCHSDCELYLDAKKEAEETKKKVVKARREEFIVYSEKKARQKEAIKRWYQRYGV